jgi:hypothetical protein
MERFNWALDYFDHLPADALALWCVGEAEEQLSFGDLRIRSNQVGNHLRDLGVHGKAPFYSIKRARARARGQKIGKRRIEERPWRVQSSGPLPPAALHFYRPSLCSPMSDLAHQRSSRSPRARDPSGREGHPRNAKP